MMLLSTLKHMEALFLVITSLQKYFSSLCIHVKTEAELEDTGDGESEREPLMR